MDRIEGELISNNGIYQLKPTITPASTPIALNTDWDEIRDAFERLDANGDGEITMDEILE